MTAKQKKEAANQNVLFILIDNLCFDRFEDSESLSIVAPTISDLAQAGNLFSLVANSHATQFVMPALFTQTYPLDYQAYNHGIAHRPKSFVECLQAAGYRTLGVMGQNLNGPLARFERGFDDFSAIIDSRVLVQNYLKETLYHEIELWREGAQSKDKMIEIVQDELGQILAQNITNLHRINSPGLPKKLCRLSETALVKYRQELELLKAEPDVIINKLQTIPPHLYVYALGQRIPGIGYKIASLLSSLSGKLQGLLSKIPGYNGQINPHRVPSTASELLNVLFEKISKSEDKWFGFVHLMDIHDYRLLNRMGLLLQRLYYLPRCLRALYSSDKKHSLMHDIALAKLDTDLKSFLKKLRAKQKNSEPIQIVLTSDHGAGWNAARPPSYRQEFGFRTFREHLSIPLIFAPKLQNINSAMSSGHKDSLAVSATLLAHLEIDGDKSFRGISAFEGGRNIVISENAGRGAADLKRDDLFFTLTGQQYKLMVRLTSDNLIPEMLFDLKDDPDECRNLIDNPDKDHVIATFMETLLCERQELLSSRGAELCLSKRAGLN